MIRLPVLTFLLAALVPSAPANADTRVAQPYDFAYGMVMNAPGTYTTYAVDLPADVYRVAVWPDLRDVRAFNAAGEAIPFRLEHKPWEDAATSVTLSFSQYPVQRRAEASDGALLEVRADDGRVAFRYAVEGGVVDEKAGDKSPARNEVLIDLGEKHLPAGEIRLGWKGPDNRAMPGMVRVSVAQSDDLQTWTQLHADWRLAHLTFGDESLVRDTLPLPGVTARYLRVSSLEADGPALTVRSITGRRHQRTEVEPRWLQPFPRKEESPSRQTFDIDGVFPVDRLRVSLEETNMLLGLLIESRPDEEAQWRKRAGGTVFKARLGEGEMTEDTIVFPAVTDRHWRITIETGGGVLPPVTFGYVPHRLTFMPQGRAPYTLAYGRAEVDRRAGGLERFEHVLHERGVTERPSVGAAQTASAMVLAGGDVLTVAPDISTGKRVVLWAILVSVVAAVGLMAWRLYGELQERG